MPIFQVGDQRVGIERDVPVLDGSGNPVYDELGDAQVNTVVVWVDNACFEPQTPTEQPDFVTTTSIMAGATLPVTSDRVIPAVDDLGADASLAFFDGDGNPTVSANARLICNGLRYEMRGDAVLEEDIHGRPDHVFCMCQRNG